MRHVQMQRLGAFACVTALTLVGLSLSTTAAFAANPTDTNFAGYLTGQPTVSSVSTTISVPRITCDAESNLAMGVGAVIYGNSGTPTDSGAVLRTLCINGAATYSVEVIVNGTKTFPKLKIRPGNTIEIDAAESPTATSVSVANDNTGKAASQSSSGGVTMTVLEIGDIAMSGTSGPPAFKSTTFSGTLVNGGSLGSLSPAPAPLDWANSGVRVIRTSPITSGAFTTKFI
jgi:hypothetical protein